MSSLELFWKKIRKYFKKDNSPYHSKTSNWPVCLAKNGLWLPNMVSQETTDKQTENCSGSIGEENVNLNLQDKMHRDQEKNKDNWHNTPWNLKWKWAGYIAKMKDSRLTKYCTRAPSGNQGEAKRSRGRPSRWQDDIASKEGTTWNRIAAHRGQWKALMEGYIWLDRA